MSSRRDGRCWLASRPGRLVSRSRRETWCTLDVGPRVASAGRGEINGDGAAAGRLDDQSRGDRREESVWHDEPAFVGIVDGRLIKPLAGGPERVLSPADLRSFMVKVHDHKEGVVPRDFKGSQHDSAPWFEAPGVNRQRYEELLAQHGRTVQQDGSTTEPAVRARSEAYSLVGPGNRVRDAPAWDERSGSQEGNRPGVARSFAAPDAPTINELDASTESGRFHVLISSAHDANVAGAAVSSTPMTSTGTCACSRPRTYRRVRTEGRSRRLGVQASQHPWLFSKLAGGLTVVHHPATG